MFKIETNANGGWIIPAFTEIDARFEIPAYSEIGSYCTLGNRCTLGDYCTLGDDCTLGDYCTLGNRCTLGDYCTLGDGCTLGNAIVMGENTTWLGVKVESWLTLAGVDGKGLQVVMVKYADGVKVNAGCFVGTLEEFIEKATDKGMARYVAVLSAVAAVM